MKRGLLCLIAFLGAVISMHMPAQGASSQAKGSLDRAVGAGKTMELDVVVTDQSGSPVAGLELSDFKLLDNGQPVTIGSIEAANGMKAKGDPPVEAFVVIDAVNTSFTTVSEERQWLADFLKQNGGELALPTSLIFLSDQGMAVQNQASRDGDKMLQFMNEGASGLRTIRKSGGYWGAVERMELSLRSLSQFAASAAGKPGRKLLIWISPGWPGFIGETVNMTTKAQTALFAGIVGYSTTLREAGITLYSIDPEGAGHQQFLYQDYLKGVAGPHRVNYGALMLQVLATQSGGLALSGSNNLARLLDQCIADARAYYVLRFPLPAASHADEYHRLDVQLDKPGLKARTRMGYYARPSNLEVGPSPAIPAPRPVN